jgi:hypothetical protein
VKRLAFSLLLMFFAGCRSADPPRHIVILIDVSGSIDPESATRAFGAIVNLGSTLKRGERLSIIPITGDAANDSPNRIIRISIPSARQAYNADLRTTQLEITRSLLAARIESQKHPTQYTDILGAIRIADEEFSTTPAFAHRLAVLSDFIQDDGRVNFRTSPLYRSPTSLGEKLLLPGSQMSTKPAAVFLGKLRSRDNTELSLPRREAIRKYWKAMFQQSTTRLLAVEDGAGLLVDAMNDNLK